MRENFSAARKFTTWRKIWIALAESQKELGLPITDEQIAELKEHAEEIDYELAARYERELRHDIMAHIHAWGERCPKARAILHLGATSCDITDNSDLIAMREGLRILRVELVNVARRLRAFALEWRSLPVLGLTHFQPAQATTLGKRACLWLHDVLLNLKDLDQAEDQILFRGVKGTTGTQASFLELFRGDHAKVRELDQQVTRRMGFERSFLVTGQTYPRQLDFRVCQCLSALAQSAAKFAGDVRLSAGRGELEEPFEKKQVGSSAMPWKRNPMRCERITSLARYVISSLDNLAHTAANQWFERTLDDSANRRLALSEMFLATDAILQLYLDVAGGLIVHPAILRKNLEEQLPFLATEPLLMEAVRSGADRQDAHERLRVLSREAFEAVQRGEQNPLRDLLQQDPLFRPLRGRLDEILDPARFVGRAPEQASEFIAAEVDPYLERQRGVPEERAELQV